MVDRVVLEGGESLEVRIRSRRERAVVVAWVVSNLTWL